MRYTDRSAFPPTSAFSISFIAHIRKNLMEPNLLGLSSLKPQHRLSLFLFSNPQIHLVYQALLILLHKYFSNLCLL